MVNQGDLAMSSPRIDNNVSQFGFDSKFDPNKEFLIGESIRSEPDQKRYRTKKLVKKYL